jgi:hypothetical protein
MPFAEACGKRVAPATGENLMRVPDALSGERGRMTPRGQRAQAELLQVALPLPISGSMCTNVDDISISFSLGGCQAVPHWLDLQDG